MVIRICVKSASSLLPARSVRYARSGLIEPPSLNFQTRQQNLKNITPEPQRRHFIACGAFHRGKNTHGHRSKKLPRMREHAGVQVTEEYASPGRTAGGLGGDVRRAL
jgi:hypothetical protein